MSFDRKQTIPDISVNDHRYIHSLPVLEFAYAEAVIGALSCQMEIMESNLFCSQIAHN